MAPPQSLRIAQVVPGLTGGGLERVVTDLTMALARRGHVVEVFSAGEPGIYTGRLAAAGITVHDCQPSRVRIPFLPIPFVRSLRRFRGDVFHSHSGTWYPSVAAGVVLDTPVIYTDHGRYPPEKRVTLYAQHWQARFTRHVVSVAEPLSKYLRTNLRLSYLPRVVENGIDLSPFLHARPDRRAALRAELGFPDSAVVVAMLGRLEPVKNPSALLNAMASPELAHVYAIFLGAGSLESVLRNHVAAAGLGDRVRFLGFRADIYDCLGAADVFAMPSLTEGLPIALLEAMAAGLPVIASAVGGIPSALGEPAGGLLVPPGDDNALREGLKRLVDSPAYRRELGARSRAAVARYTIERMTDIYEGLYRTMHQR